MSVHRAAVRWRREGDFASGHYSRLHEIQFDGVTLRGSASPHNVPAGVAGSNAADPEQLFVAALSSCHMLWFLDLARQAGVIVETYDDEAEGVLGKDADGHIAVTRVVLRPKVASPATEAQIADLHHAAHARCFIANSVKSEVLVEPR